MRTNLLVTMTSLVYIQFVNFGINAVGVFRKMCGIIDEVVFHFCSGFKFNWQSESMMFRIVPLFNIGFVSWLVGPVFSSVSGSP